MHPLLPKCCRPSLHIHATVRFLYKSKLKWPSCCSFCAICAFFQLVLLCAACFPVKWPSFCSSTEVVACSKQRKWCCCHLVFKPYKEDKVEDKGSLLLEVARRL